MLTCCWSVNRETLRALFFRLSNEFLLNKSSQHFIITWSSSEGLHDVHVAAPTWSELAMKRTEIIVWYSTGSSSSVLVTCIIQYDQGGVLRLLTRTTRTWARRRGRGNGSQRQVCMRVWIQCFWAWISLTKALSHDITLIWWERSFCVCTVHTGWYHLLWAFGSFCVSVCAFSNDRLCYRGRDVRCYWQ